MPNIAKEHSFLTLSNIYLATACFIVLKLSAIISIVGTGWYLVWRLVLSKKDNVQDIVAEVLGWNDEEKKRKKEKLKKDRQRRRPSMIQRELA